jgi:tetratricopeptide (TPR) repeat protein/acyl carrier protein
MAKEEEARALFKFAGISDQDVDGLIKATEKLSDFCSKGEAEISAAYLVAGELLGQCRKQANRNGEGKILHGMATVQATDGKIAEALATAQDALDIFQDVNLSSLEAMEYYSIASMYSANQQHRKALYYGQESFAISGSKQALGIIVKSYIAKGLPDQAVTEAGDALRAYQEKGDSAGCAEAQMLSFLAFQQTGDMDMALTSLDEAVHQFKELGDKTNECNLLVMAAELHLKEGSYAKAADESLRAMELVKAEQKWTEMASALKCHVDAKIAMGETKDAVAVAIDARETFEQAGATKSEAAACLALSSAHRAAKKYDRAATAAKAAQEIAYQEEDEKGEATALGIMADVYMQDDKFDKAVRSAEQARRLWKGLQNLPAEANALNIIAQAYVNMQHRKEAMDASSGVTKKTDGWEKALKAGNEALKIARELSDEQNGGLFQATALCTLAEVQLAKKSGAAALDHANEAVALFMDGKEEASAAYAWVLCAQADVLLEDYNQARDDAMEGIEIFKNVGDDRGQSYAQSVFDLAEKLAPAPAASFDMAAMQAMMAAGGGGGAAQWKFPPSAQKSVAAAPTQAAPPPDAKTASRAPRAGGSALAVNSSLTAEVVTAKIKEIAMGIVGDDEDIEVDTPLMQAGLTSNTAVTLRDELSQDLQGISLPPTLLFDYPSIQGIADFIVEKAQSM